MVCPQVHKMEAELRHKLFPPNAWMNSHPLLSNEAVARVFKRLADRLQGVVSDTSTITITPEYAAHFLEVYVKKTDGAKFTGDRIRLLMLSLPLAVRDLIARHSTHMQSIYHNKPYIWNIYTWYIPLLLSSYIIYIVLLIMVYSSIFFVIYHIFYKYILGIY